MPPARARRPLAETAIFGYNERILKSSSLAVFRLLRLFLPALGVLGIIVIFGVTFYARGTSIMDEQLRQHLRSVAAVAALEIDGSLVDAVRGPDGAGKAQYRAMVRKLRAMRDSVPSVRFAYVLRRTDDPRVLEFVADADGLSSDAELDTDGDGEVGDDEAPAMPGDEYDITEAPALQGDAFMRATVDPEPTVDQWGTLFSGYAPIRRADGSVAGVLGIDMDAAEYLRVVHSVFSPIGLLFVLLTAALLAAQLGFLQWRRQVQALRQVDVERLALMNLASHQLGGPLATFKWWIELLREKGNAIDPTQAYDELSVGVTRMETIMKALQAANRFAQGRVEPREEDIDLRELATKTVEDVRSRMRSGADIRLDMDASPITVRADRQLLTGAIGELLENATQYAPESPVTLRVRTRNGKATIEVEDAGKGIAKEELPHVFEKFARGKDASRFKTGGNGLGLYIVKTITEMFGGKAAVRSGEGRGTTFTLTLPLA